MPEKFLVGKGAGLGLSDVKRGFKKDAERGFERGRGERRDKRGEERDCDK